MLFTLDSMFESILIFVVRRNDIEVKLWLCGIQYFFLIVFKFVVLKIGSYFDCICFILFSYFVHDEMFFIALILEQKSSFV